MFTFRIEGAYDAEQLLDRHWPTCAVTVIQRGAKWTPRGPHHIVVPMSDVGDPKMSPDAPRAEHLRAILAHTEHLTDADTLLVNCWLGQSRSSATLLAILIQHGMTPTDAFAAMLEQRPVAIPNVLICKLIDQHFGLTEVEAMANDHLRRELANVMTPPDEAPTQKEVDDMKKWLSML